MLGQAQPRARCRVRYRINGGPVRSAPDARVDRRRALRRRERRPLPRHARAGRAAPNPGDTRGGVVRGRPATRSDSFKYEAVSDSGDRVLVLAAEDYTGASPVARRSDPAVVPVLLHRRARCQRGSHDVYDVDANGRHGSRRTGRAEPLRRRGLVHGQRRHHPRARMGAGQRVAAWRSASCSRCATSSTRAAACSTRASTPGTSTHGPRHPVLRPVQQRQCTVAIRRSWPCAVR